MVSQPPTPWTEPQPVMNDNLHHLSRFHRIAANVAKLPELLWTT